MGPTGLSVAGISIFLISCPIAWMTFRCLRKRSTQHLWFSYAPVIELSLVLSLGLFLISPPNARPNAASENGNPVELTEVDLFSLPDWQHRPVAIEGFVLGMTRSEARRLAEDHDLKFLPNMPRKTGGVQKGSCLQTSCAVYKVHGNYIGIDLYFDAADHVSKMGVSVSVDMDPEVKRSNVSRRFRGLTYELFDHYSDSLRKKIFGLVEGKEKPFIPASAITRFEYDYPQAGVLVRVTTDKRDDPARSLDLDVEFSARHLRIGK